MRHKIVPVFIPHASCKNRCIFCDQQKITGVSTFDISSIEATIKECIGANTRGALSEIAFYGGSFTAIAPDEQESLLRLAKGYIDSGAVDSVRVSTRPDCIDEEILDRLKIYGVKTIELGVQSMSDEVLLANKRGHTRSDTVNASQMIKSAGFTLGHQIMPGLYRDTKETMLETVDESLRLAPDIMRVYPCLVVKGTELAELYSAGSYEPLTLDGAVDICKRIYLRARKKGVKIIRMGIHPERDFVENGFIAGPFHPAFKFLVESSLFFDMSDLVIGGNSLSGDITVYLNERDRSNFTGDKRCNIKRIKEKYPLSNINIESSGDIEKGNISIAHNGLRYDASIADI